MNATMTALVPEQPVLILWKDVALEGDLTLPQEARGIVLFAHGSGSSRYSLGDRYVAQKLQASGFATLLLDLLTHTEEAINMQIQPLHQDISLLAERLVGATDWLERYTDTRALPVGYFATGSGAGAALSAAAERPGQIGAVVSRGGRPDLAGSALPYVLAPTLLIAGEHDASLLPLQQRALAQMSAEASRIYRMPDATHRFAEPETSEQVASLAAGWFARYLCPSETTCHARDIPEQAEIASQIRQELCLVP